jgi:cobalamin biosynthesis Mg chelatase CobN
VLCCVVLCCIVPQAFKAAERRMLEAQVLQELDLDKSCLEKLPRKVKEALWQGGVPAMLKAGLTQPQIQRLRSGQQQQEQQQGMDQKPAAAAAAAELQEDAGAASSSGVSSSADEAQEDRVNSSHGASSSSSSSEGGSTQYGPYFKRQHLFVAATMPALTKGDVGTELQKRFPSALWVSGDMLHQVRARATVTSACSCLA